MLARIQKIVEHWYITEPAFFQIYVTHNLEENTKMSCPFRCGKGSIQYNPDIIKDLSIDNAASYLKAEILRILLKHPYARQPVGCKRKSMSIGSNIVLADNYDFEAIGLPKPDKYNLARNESYEWYSRRIEELVPAESTNDSNDQSDCGDNVNIGGDTTNANENNELLDGEIEMQLPNGMTIKVPTTGSQSNSSNEATDKDETTNDLVDNSSTDLSALWEEDSVMSCSIDVAIDEINSTPGAWGSISGNLASLIVANTKAKIDYRKVLAGFRSSIISSKRNLTRMRPNRRSGFENMGSIRRFSTNLLVAVDVSGSVSSKSLSHFYSIINRVFKYGIEHISAVQFDTQIKDVESFDKARKNIKILGRGGTNFQPVFDYVAKHPEYDGLIIFTDGYSPEPHKPKGFRCKVAWICDDKRGYEENKGWMKKTGRCCLMEI
jgi:predicted metal-dependent peptidase